MLVKAGLLLLVVWLIGQSGLYDIGDVNHVFLLSGLMLLLLAVARAREAAMRPPPPPDKR